MNERIRAVDDAFGVAAYAYRLLCECGVAGCSERLEVPTAVYRDILRQEGYFVVAPGHERRGRHDLVATARDYAVVAGHVASRPAVPEVSGLAS